MMSLEIRNDQKRKSLLWPNLRKHRKHKNDNTQWCIEKRVSYPFSRLMVSPFLQNIRVTSKKVQKSHFCTIFSSLWISQIFNQKFSYVTFLFLKIIPYTLLSLSFKLWLCEKLRIYTTVYNGVHFARFVIVRNIPGS